jgi:hypothetical protein
MQRIFYGVQIFMKLLFCFLEHLDSLRLGHAKRLMSWVGLYSCWGKFTLRDIALLISVSRKLLVILLFFPWTRPFVLNP